MCENEPARPPFLLCPKLEPRENQPCSRRGRAQPSLTTSVMALRMMSHALAMSSFEMLSGGMKLSTRARDRERGQPSRSCAPHAVPRFLQH